MGTPPVLSPAKTADEISTEPNPKEASLLKLRTLQDAVRVAQTESLAMRSECQFQRFHCSEARQSAHTKQLSLVRSLQDARIRKGHGRAKTKSKALRLLYDEVDVHADRLASEEDKLANLETLLAHSEKQLEQRQKTLIDYLLAPHQPLHLPFNVDAPDPLHPVTASVSDGENSIATIPPIIQEYRRKLERIAHIQHQLDLMDPARSGLFPPLETVPPEPAGMVQDPVQKQRYLLTQLDNARAEAQSITELCNQQGYNPGGDYQTSQDTTYTGQLIHAESEEPGSDMTEASVYYVGSLGDDAHWVHQEERMDRWLFFVMKENVIERLRYRDTLACVQLHPPPNTIDLTEYATQTWSTETGFDTSTSIAAQPHPTPPSEIINHLLGVRERRPN